MYNIIQYGRMIGDRVRINAYSEALRQTVRPGSVVLDIGTGTGIFALLACRFGARRVYALEPGDVIQVAREIAGANGYANRIEFIQRPSHLVTLPEQADVIVSDLRGMLPLFQHHLPAIVDARRRLLAPGGALIPQRDAMWAALVEAPDSYDRHMTLWAENGSGFDMTAARRIAANVWTKTWLEPEQLLTDPQRWAILDYATVESPDAAAEVTWTVARAGTAHGLIMWFDATLGEGVSFSNAPGAQLIYGSAFFPWPTPVPLAAGDAVCVVLEAKLIGQDYVWRWDTDVLSQGHPGNNKARFRQSTFHGAPLSLETLRRTASTYVPTLSEDGQINGFILTSIDGQTSNEQLARRVFERFPNRFARWEDALTRVGELLTLFSR